MKFRLLLLDANIIIYLHELGIWETFIRKCSVTLTPTVVDESKFWEDNQGAKHQIDLTKDIDEKTIQIIEVPLETIGKFMKKYGPVYADRLDDGEAESLAFLMDSQEKWMISSADEIVFKVLGYEGRAEQGVSLEEILNKIGMTQSGIRYQYTKAFSEKIIHKGQIDNIQGF